MRRWRVVGGNPVRGVHTIVTVYKLAATPEFMDCTTDTSKTVFPREYHQESYRGERPSATWG